MPISSRQRRAIKTIGLSLAIASASPALAQTGVNPAKEDLGQAQKIYSPYVARTARNNQFAEGVYWGEMTRTVWERQIRFADQYNDPGNFTALIGFEWTSINTMAAPSNLHRVVIFKDDASKAGQVLPYSTFDSYDPEDLWQYMADYEAKTGGSVLAIPHNGNLSNGLMFATERLNGDKIDKKYAETRMRWEPLYEVTQIKGDGEAHPRLSVNDEFADYDNWEQRHDSRCTARPSGTRVHLPDLVHAVGQGQLRVGVLG